MALQTRGFALSALQDIPQVPQNIGKVDVGAIYDAASKGVALANLMSSNQQQQEVLGGQRRLALAQQGSEQAQIPSATAAGIAQNTALATTAPATAAATVAKAGGEVAAQPSATAATIAGNTEKSAVAPSATASQIATNEKTKLDADLANVYTAAGLKYAPDIADSIEATRAGLINSLKNSGGAPVSHAITTPDGRPLGSVIAYADGTGQPHVQFAPMPFGALSRINTSISYSPIGTVNDPTSGQPQYTQYQEVMKNAAGGITKGQVVKVAYGEPPPGPIFMGSNESAPAPAAGATGAPSAPQPGAGVAAPVGATGPAQVTQTGATPGAAVVTPQGATGPAAPPNAGASLYQGRAGIAERRKALDETTDALGALQSNRAELDHVWNQVDQYQKSSLGSGEVVGSPLAIKVRGIFGDASGQALQGSVSQALNNTLAPLRKLGRVNQTEFQQALQAQPETQDYPETYAAKKAYSYYIQDTLEKRTQAALDAQNQGIDPPDAWQQAMKKFPLKSLDTFQEAPGGRPGEIVGRGAQAPTGGAGPTGGGKQFKQADVTPVSNHADGRALAKGTPYHIAGKPEVYISDGTGSK